MPHRPDVSLRVFAAMALCVVVALATTLLAFDRFNRAALTTATARDLQQLVDLQRDQVEALIDARVDQTRLLAALPGVREDLQRQREASSDGAMANRLQRFTEHGNGLRLLAVVDPDSGRVLAASDARLLDISLSAHPLLHDSRNDAIVYGPQPSPLLQLHGLTVATPMRDGD
ncbi:MAG TPA: hypothetical protein VFY12_10970, partial [Arenimonas sp.]|nr:hypothetical protein [Arenimonas sp.]